MPRATDYFRTRRGPHKVNLHSHWGYGIQPNGPIDTAAVLPSMNFRILHHDQVAPNVIGANAEADLRMGSSREQRMGKRSEIYRHAAVVDLAAKQLHEEKVHI